MPKFARELRRDVGDERHEADDVEAEVLGDDSIEKCDLSFGFKNHSSFGLRFPALRKSSKMDTEEPA